MDIANLFHVLYTLLFAAQITALIFYVEPTAPSIKSVVPSQALALAVVPALSYLSLPEHIRSFRSSDCINVFLFFSTMFDAVQVRTLWLRLASKKLAATTSVCFALKLMLLFAEVQGKKRYLHKKYQNLASEMASGVIA